MSPEDKKRQAQALWENREALDKYLKRLEELYKEDENKTSGGKTDTSEPATNVQ